MDKNMGSDSFYAYAHAKKMRQVLVRPRITILVCGECMGLLVTVKIREYGAVMAGEY
jgi:hypothetical protein